MTGWSSNWIDVIIVNKLFLTSGESVTLESSRFPTSCRPNSPVSEWRVVGRDVPRPLWPRIDEWVMKRATRPVWPHTDEGLVGVGNERASLASGGWMVGEDDSLTLIPGIIDGADARLALLHPVTNVASSCDDDVASFPVTSCWSGDNSPGSFPITISDWLSGNACSNFVSCHDLMSRWTSRGLVSCQNLMYRWRHQWNVFDHDLVNRSGDIVFGHDLINRWRSRCHSAVSGHNLTSRWRPYWDIVGHDLVDRWNAIRNCCCHDRRFLRLFVRFVHQWLIGHILLVGWHLWNALATFEQRAFRFLNWKKQNKFPRSYLIYMSVRSHLSICW